MRLGAIASLGIGVAAQKGAVPIAKFVGGSLVVIKGGMIAGEMAVCAVESAGLSHEKTHLALSVASLIIIVLTRLRTRRGSIV